MDKRGIPSEPRAVIAFRGSLNQYIVQAEVATKGSASYSIKICRKRSPDGSI